MKKLRLKQNYRFRCGITTFELSPGAVVTLKQTDKTFGKVLLDFGDRQIDWFDKKILSIFEFET